MIEVKALLSLTPEMVKKPSYNMSERVFDQMAAAYTYVVGSVAIAQSIDNELTDAFAEVLESLSEDRSIYFYSSVRGRMSSKAGELFKEKPGMYSANNCRKAVELGLKNFYCDMFDVVSAYFKGSYENQQIDYEKFSNTLNTFFEWKAAEKENERLKAEAALLDQKLEELKAAEKASSPIHIICSWFKGLFQKA